MKINLTDQSIELVTKYCNELSMSHDDFVNHCIIDYSLPVSSNFVYCQNCSKSLWIKSLYPAQFEIRKSNNSEILERIYEPIKKIECPHCNHVQDYDFNLEKWLGSNQHRIDIGNRIKNLRITKGWNQNDLASKSGLSQQTISKVEKGIFAPTLDILNKIADALNAEITISHERD